MKMKTPYMFMMTLQAQLFSYHKKYKLQLPKITPHVCRHTFCSKMAGAGMDPKKLQYIMGHSDITVMMNTYCHNIFLYKMIRCEI